MPEGFYPATATLDVHRHCWIAHTQVTARSKLSLGAWLEERRLPIKKGTQRKSRQQRAAEAEARRTPSPPPLPSTAPRPAPLPTSLPAPRPVHTALPQLAAPSPLPHCLLPAVQPPLLPSFPSFPSIPSFPSLPHQPLLLTPMASYPRVISTCLDAGPAHSRPTSPAASTSSTQQHHLPPAPPLAAPAAAAAVWRSPSPFLPPTRSVSPLLSGTDSVPSASGTSTAAAATAAAVAATATSPAAGKGLAAEAAAGVEAAAMVEVAARVVAEDVGVPLAGPVLEGDMVLGLGSIFEDGDLDDGDLQGALTDSFFAFLHADD